MSLYHSPLGIFDFQAEGVASSYLRPSTLAVWDTGTGKTHLAMVLSALGFEDGIMDRVLVVCESDKLAEWVEDYRTFTDLKVEKFYGDLKRRHRVLASDAQVLVSTYETVRNDSGAKGFLTEALTGQRVLVVYDEMTKLKTRTSVTYKNHEVLLREIRKKATTFVVGLTATPIERDPENVFNIARLLIPGFMTVEQFKEQHVAYYDHFDRPAKFKNISEHDHFDPEVVTLRDKLAPILSIKKKTDPDVRDFFPRQVEEFTYVKQTKLEADFYTACEEALEEYALASKIPDELQRASFGVLRQIAGHPESLLRSEGQMAKHLVDIVGREGIQRIGSSKLDALLRYVEPLVKGQGAQAVIFTFYAKSILPIIEEALVSTGYKVSCNHGGMTRAQRDQSKLDFTEGRTQIFLTSDAGARGINLKTAEYVINYELPLTHANYIQRINRIHRIDSHHPSVTCQSFITALTVEEAIVGLNQKRNQWADQLLDDEEDGSTRLTAEDRKVMLRLSRDKVLPRKRSRNPWVAAA